MELSRRGFLGWAACSTLLGACGKVDRPDSGFAGPREVPLEFEPGPRGPIAGLHRFPKTSLRGFGFEGELTSKPIFLDGVYEVSFVPAVNGLLAPGVFKVSAVTSDGVVDLMRANVDAGYGVIGATFFVKTDLSRFAGRRIALRWSFRPNEPGAPVTRAVVGMPRVFRSDARPARPHIILVCSDTHRYDYCLTPDGAGLMPAFTDFCRDAVAFDRAYANASWTIPSTTSVMTGVNPYRHGAGWRVDVNEDLVRRAGGKTPPERAKATKKRNYDIIKHDPRLYTFQEMLSAAGYCSVCLAGNQWIRFAESAEDGFDLTTKELPIGTPAENGAMLMRNARTLLEHWPRQQPLLLYVHSNHVHNYAREAPLMEARDGKRAFPDPELWRTLYGKRVREFDGQFDSLMASIREAGILDDAAVVFYADHGEQLLECGDRWGHGNAMTETLLHVPLALKPPTSQDFGPGRRGTPVQLLDLAPTLVDLALGRDGLKRAGDQFEGRSLAPLAAGEQPWGPRPMVSGIQFNGPELASVRYNGWKYVYNLDDATGALDRYDDGEPCEAGDASSAKPATARRLRSVVTGAWTRFIDETLGEERTSLGDLTPEQRDDLESMGYL